MNKTTLRILVLVGVIIIAVVIFAVIYFQTSDNSPTKDSKLGLLFLEYAGGVEGMQGYISYEVKIFDSTTQESEKITEIIIPFDTDMLSFQYADERIFYIDGYNSLVMIDLLTDTSRQIAKPSRKLSELGVIRDFEVIGDSVYFLDCI